jgi:hypothetical protein
MIEGYLGRPGSGKSYSLTHLAIEQAERGRPVFTNYALSHPNVQLFGPDDLLDLPPGLICIDEAHLWFPARGAMRLPPSWLALLSQTRKRGWDLYWTAQHEKRVDSVLRDVSSWFWNCSAWFEWSGHPVLFRMDGYEPENFRQTGKRQLRKYRSFSPRVAAAYDTMESIEVAKHATSKDDAYASKPKAVA